MSMFIAILLFVAAALCAYKAIDCIGGVDGEVLLMGIWLLGMVFFVSTGGMVASL